MEQNCDTVVRGANSPNTIVTGRKLELLEKVVYHPVICCWFLVSDQNFAVREDQRAHITETMSFCVAEFLLVAVDCIGFGHCKTIVQPFIDRIYKRTMDELAKLSEIKGKHLIKHSSNYQLHAKFQNICFHNL